jgi:putative heme-binding domain-containing protein
MRGVSRLAFFAVALPAAFAQHGSTTRSNPFSSPEDQAEGAGMFRSQCATCHGPAGAGGDAGPALARGALRRGDSDEALFQTVLNGISGTPMPAFPGNAREAWQVVAYVRSLRSARTAGAASGDTARGALLFERSRCRACHSVRGAGGRIAPDLAGIGSWRSPAQLQAAITDPAREVAPAWWTLRARTRTGRRIEGIRLNEDTHSFQYQDEGGLRSVLKADLAEHEIVRTSPMPSYAGKLTAEDLQHLVAYLASLREGNRP